MIAKIQRMIARLLSIGVYPGMEGNKKLAIQIATFDAYVTLITIFSYTLNSDSFQIESVLNYYYVALVLISGSVFFFKTRRYDAARFIGNFVGVSLIFVSVDLAGVNSGFEYYYFTTSTIPFLTFTSDEVLKSICLSVFSSTVFLTQQYMGSGIFFKSAGMPPDERLVCIAVVIIFMLLLFSVARWQMNVAQMEIKRQQGELIHSSNILALGEMSGNIAHEINNPLQILMSHVESLQRQFKREDGAERVVQQLDIMDRTIDKMAKLVKGLRNLSRDVSADNMTLFSVSEVVDEVYSISEQRLKDLGVKFYSHGEEGLKVKGHAVQLSQVLINLLNNSVDAIEHLEEKWIKVEVYLVENKIHIAVTDSGKGISSEVARKIMHPFYTTKDPGKGTGLGLSISKSIIEKKGGAFTYDSESMNTRFVIELPKGE